MKKIATAFTLGCLWLTASNVQAQVQNSRSSNNAAAANQAANVRPGIPSGARINPNLYRANLSRHPMPSMKVGTGKTGTMPSNGQMPANGMNNMNPGMNGMYPGMNQGAYPGMYPGMNPYGQYPGFYPGF